MLHQGGYNSSDYALCLVCHLEEKIVAKMSGENGYLANYMNQTNFRDEYYGWYEGFSSINKPINIHSPQVERDHPKKNCYSCHNPHGSDNPATIRNNATDGGPINYTYITNVSSTDNNTAWEVLDYANWNNTTANKGGGLPYLISSSNGCYCHWDYEYYH